MVGKRRGGGRRNCVPPRLRGAGRRVVLRPVAAGWGRWSSSTSRGWGDLPPPPWGGSERRCHQGTRRPLRRSQLGSSSRSRAGSACRRGCLRVSRRAARPRFARSSSPAPRHGRTRCLSLAKAGPHFYFPCRRIGRTNTNAGGGRPRPHGAKGGGGELKKRDVVCHFYHL